MRQLKTGEEKKKKKENNNEEANKKNAEYESSVSRVSLTASSV